MILAHTINVMIMKEKDFNENLIKFIKKGTCSYTCISEIKNVLEENGYKELEEQKEWTLNDNKYYIIRNDASIIAFEIPKDNANSFKVITTHSDTPSLILKPSGENIKENYLKYNIMPYGGLLNYGWLDHPLSLAGRVVIKKENKLLTKIVDFDKPLAVVPSVAIHQNSNANSSLDLNMQVDLQPIIGLSNNKSDWNKLLKEQVKEEIIDYDLFFYSYEEPRVINNNILVSPRIDNLTSVYAGLYSFLNSKSNDIKVYCSFNNEEIGSLTEEGADSTFLIDILKRLANELNIDITRTLANSFVISSDNTHAIHPNHVENADDTGVSYLGDGFTIIKESMSTTNAISSAVIKTICDKNNIKYQDSTSKNDISGGSTLSGISLRHVSVLSIDVGIPQLSMHSSVETCSLIDVYELYKMMKNFYKTNIKRKKDNVLID
ncbi:MAG: M18 family aminopeptidase [Firmicutes bacterium]|nr:M18 family aminopeptidase [Bacillota bacterium]